MAEVPDLLNFNNKQENNGKDSKGKLTAHEFNQVVNAVNANTEKTFSLDKQVGNLSFSVQASEADYEALENKEANTVYFVLEE